MSVTVTPIGKARQGYRVHDRTGSWDVRTQSPARYLVIDRIARAVARRTDDLKTATRVADKLEQRRGSLLTGEQRTFDPRVAIVIDRRIIDARSAQILDTARGVIS